MKKGFGTNCLTWILVLSVLLLWSCKDEEIGPSPQVSEVNNFIYDNMKEAYLWNDGIPQDIDPNSEMDPEAFFTKLLNKPTDRWSFITDDYEALINNFKGIEKTFGHKFRLFLVPGSDNIIGVVEYVVPGSPADRALIKRGDIFYKVGGTTLTVANYSDLLFDRDIYTLTFGKFGDNGIISSEGDKTLSAEVVAENPVFMKKTFTLEGSKIGYLVYNQFIDDYSDSLISAFSEFKQEGINDLVLDLRYNPGGSINNAILLGSMIAPLTVTENKEIFSKIVWNETITNEFLREGGPDSDRFVDRFFTPEVNLNLNKVYILVSGNTASAGELVINCLSPYMDVVLIGPENTTGKFVGSVTIYDAETSNGWAMQPIVLKTANVSGYTDFINGFEPDYIISDDFRAALGSLQEDMLAKSIELITGKVITESARISDKYIPSGLSAVTYPDLEKRQNMYYNINP